MVSTHWSAVRNSGRHFRTKRGPGEVYLHADGTCLYLDFWHEDAVRLTIAFRGLAPADLDPIFCDEGCTGRPATSQAPVCRNVPHITK